MKRISMLLAATLCAFGAFAADPLAQAPDQEFFDKAAVAGMFEVQSSEIALQLGSDPAIKSFAQMMVTDHSAANAKLKSLALAKGVMLPTGLDKDHQAKLEKLKAAKPGKEFDETYADLMEDGHDDAVQLFEKASKKAKDKDVQKLAAETLPTLKHHSEKAEKLDKKRVAP
ncbi:DUF305 domain-containing protein [Solimonas fluminis]|uniref:DUF305 domain-containing protein n=1 Tax=Solimonas fluminis TaxID=2086571 RepID=A0A2S5TAI7_9GAMM|nr:DUF4142 domain-containing protein [Solimonas fluminis]PPE72021.1 DUF305 domain-containing protein [Solimonas fluminis]